MPTHREKLATLLNMNNSWEVKVGEILKCYKCTMTFDEKDDLLHHLSSSHSETTNSCRLGSPIYDGAIIKEGKYEHEESGYDHHVEIHAELSVRNAETTVLKCDSTPLDGLIGDSIAKTANGPANDGMSFGLNHGKTKADLVQETHIEKSGSYFFSMTQNFEVTQNDGTSVEASVDKKDEDCNMGNDKLGKVHEAPDISATETSHAEAVLSANKGISIQKSSNESNILRHFTGGINEFCSIEERTSKSYSISPSGNQRTCEIQENANGASSSLKKEPRQEFSYESDLAAANDKEEICAEVANDRPFASTIKEIKIDCMGKYEQHEPIFDFDNCAMYGKDVAINVKQQTVSENSHLPVPFSKEQKCGFVNNVNEVLAPSMVVSNQQRCSKSDSLMLSGHKQTYNVNNNGSWVSTVTPRVEADNSGNDGLTFGFGSNHPQPIEDAVTHVEWGIGSGSHSLISSWMGQTCFKNNTNWVSACTVEEPLQEKDSQRGAVAPSCQEQIWDIENNGNKFSIGTVDKAKFNEINNSRNSELIISSDNTVNTGVDMDGQKSAQKQRGSEVYLSFLSKNDQKFDSERVNGFCNSAVAELKLGGQSESRFCIPSEDGQKSGIENDLTRVYPVRFCEVPRLEVENPGNIELMIGYGSSRAQPGQDIMAEVVWRTDEENVQQGALADSSSSMVISSGGFPTADVISDKV